MRYLGVMRGKGSLSCGGEVVGPAEYEIEGFLQRPGEIVGSAAIRMAAADLANAIGRRDLRLTTDDGRVLEVRFSARRHNGLDTEAHADIGGDLPSESQWRR